jgi:hypothetical protein
MHYDENKYKLWSWKHPMVLFWIINPGLSINELIFGQRIPKLMLEEKNSKKILSERTFVPCPHCNTVHAGMKWSGQNKTAMQNWFGLYCDHCGKIIPCLINLTSLIVLTVTAPIWYWFKEPLKRKWLAKQPQRYENIVLNDDGNSFAGYGWIREGLSFGFFMFVAMELIIHPFLQEEPTTWKTILSGIITWTISGLAYGAIMKLFYKKR